MKLFKILLALVISALQIIGVFALVQDFSGHHGTLGGFGFFCILTTFFCLLLMFIDVLWFYKQIDSSRELEKPFFRLDYLGGVLVIEMCIMLVLTFPGFLRHDRQLAAGR